MRRRDALRLFSRLCALAVLCACLFALNAEQKVLASDCVACDSAYGSCWTQCPPGDTPCFTTCQDQYRTCVSGCLSDPNLPGEGGGGPNYNCGTAAQNVYNSCMAGNVGSYWLPFYDTCMTASEATVADCCLLVRRLYTDTMCP